MHARVSRSLPLVLAALGLAVPAAAQPVATQITPANAASLLFGGSDADGGVDDWYLSNGVVEAIIDDAALRTDLPPGVSPPPKQSEAGFTGGSLIDLGRVGRNNDQLAQLFTVGGLSTSNFILYGPSAECPTCTISASTTATTATVRVEGVLLGFDPPVPASDLRVVTEYIAAGSDPFLTVRTTVTNTSGSSAPLLGGLLDVFVWTSRAIVPFSPLPNRGFDHVELDLANPFPAIELPAFSAGPGNLGPADGIMDPTSGTPAGEVSYGLLGVEFALDPDGPGPTPPTVTPVNTLFGVSGNNITAFGNSPAGSLAAGASLTYTRRIYVGDRNDVASVANDMIPELAARTGFATGTVSGFVSATDAPAVAASVIATRVGGPAVPGFATGAPVTHFRTDPATGAFSGVVLPEGTYDLEFRAEERDPVTVAGVVVSAGSNTLVPVPAMSGKGTVTFEVFERVPGASDPLVPAKVTIVGLDVPNPRLGHDFDAFVLPVSGPQEDILPESFGGGPGQRNFVYLADGTGSVSLRPGRYELYFSRGPEYTVSRRRVRVREGRTRRVRARLSRVAEVPNALSADFHIHSARSLDASAPPRDRVASFAAEGVEVMVSTDHDFHLDYGPVIASLGIGDRITSIVGSETTTTVPNPPVFPNSIGHINAWPLPVDPTARRDGSIDDEFVAPNWIFSSLRARGAEVVQYNHPRAGFSGLTVIGFFNNIGYDPDLPITAPPNDVLLDDDVLGPGGSGVPNPDGFRNIDFDVMEILNGTDIDDYLEVRRDWLSLLNQVGDSTPSGPVPFIGGTAVSDSHRITVEAAGYGRTYVLGTGDDPAAMVASVLDANVIAGNMFGTTGPMIEFTVDDGSNTAGLGGTLVPGGSTVNLNIRVRASNWIPVDEVRVIANGFTILTFKDPDVSGPPRKPWAQGSGRVVRFDRTIPVTLAQDTYFIVEAGVRLDPLAPPDPFVDTIVPGMRPIAFTNPIFVDLAGNGFDAPGLPVEPLPGGGGGGGGGGAEVRSARAALPALSPAEREELRHHFPIHRLVIPPEAVEQALGAGGE